VVSHGWFMTGDIGVVDERGRLYLRGREREEINKGGICACSTRWPVDDLTRKPALARQNSTRRPVPCEHSTKVRAQPLHGQ